MGATIGFVFRAISGCWWKGCLIRLYAL